MVAILVGGIGTFGLDADRNEAERPLRTFIRAFIDALNSNFGSLAWRCDDVERGIVRSAANGAAPT